MSDQYTPVVPEAQFVLQMVEKYRQLLLDCAGLKAINVDGNMVTYDQLEERYDHWNKKLGHTNGTRPRVATINLENAQ